MTSSDLRKEGNVIYKKALVEGLSPLLVLSRLQHALELYNKAAEAASGPSSLGDWSSAIKNCGMTNKRMAQEYRKEKHYRDKGYEKTLNKFRESLKLMNQALFRGTPVHGQDWGHKLQDEMEASYFEVLEITNQFDNIKQRLRELYQVTTLLPDGVILAQAKYDIAEVLFKESVRLLESSDYKECLKCLHDIHQPVEEALVILGGDTLSSSDRDFQVEDLKLDLTVLKHDAHYHICTAESIQARKFGEALLTELFEEEYLNMDRVWNAVDWFKQASLKAAELDLEQEAAALSFLGLINEKILFSATKSKLYFKRCLELVEAAKPKTFTGRQWYKQCVTGFKKIQDAELLRDETEQQKIRQKILDTLNDEITTLKEANTDASSLLEYILKHHPSPKECTKFTKTHLDELRETEGQLHDAKKRKTCKGLLLKALLDFHPDKIGKTEGETDAELERRKVLVGEITKMITKYYERIKLD